MKLPKKIKDQITYQYPGDKYVKRPKYSNYSCTCRSAHRHQSILEADYCNELLLLKTAGKIKDFVSQHKIDICINLIHITNHYVDFLVTYPDGHLEFHETKGLDMETWKIKKRLVEALFPSIPYIVKRERPKFFKCAKSQ